MWAVLVGVGSAIAAAISFGRVETFFHDDAFVMLRYARNLLDGVGFVWNPGERVEGYTSFLHLVSTAALGNLTELPEAVRAVNAVAYASAVLVV